jgi:hypothetical protein
MVVLLAVAGCAEKRLGPQRQVEPHPIEDHPVRRDADAIERAMAPLVEEARAELPRLQKRYRKGLPVGSVLYFTVRIPNQAGFEQVFIEVSSWRGHHVKGTLASELMHAIGDLKAGAAMQFEDDMVVDWTIVGKDGQEEGNRLGHFVEGR